MLKIRRDDIVLVAAGKDKGKKGKVLQVSSASSRAIVEGINMMKKHLRRRREQDQSGIIEMEAPIHISNLMILCKHCSKPTRIGVKVLKDGSRSRICKKCGEIL